MSTSTTKSEMGNATEVRPVADLADLGFPVDPSEEGGGAPVTGALRAAMAGAQQNPTNDAALDANGLLTAWDKAVALARRPKFEARFFFTKHASQKTGVVLLGNVTVHDRGDDALRAVAHQLIVDDPSGEALKMVETHMVVVDVGLHKDRGGVGASHPQETLILFKPN